MTDKCIVCAAAPRLENAQCAGCLALPFPERFGKQQRRLGIDDAEALRRICAALGEDEDDELPDHDGAVIR